MYYQKKANHILVTKNPLSSQTIEVIGGKTESLDFSQKDLTILEVKWGADPDELNNILGRIRRIYLQENVKETGSIKVHHFTHPPSPTNL